MTTFGSGFFALALVLFVAGLAVLGAVTTVFTLQLRPWSSRVSRALQYFLLVVLVVVIVVTGGGAITIAADVPVVAVLLVGLVGGPLVVAGVGCRHSGLGRPDALLALVLSWSLSYLLGAIVFFGVGLGLPQLLALAPAEARAAGVGWYATLGAVLVSIVTAQMTSSRLVRSLRVPNDGASS